MAVPPFALPVTPGRNLGLRLQSPSGTPKAVPPLPVRGRGAGGEGGPRSGARAKASRSTPFSPSGQQPRCLLDGLDDVPVPRAAAEIPGQLVFDLLRRRVRIVGQERFRREQHPARAETALQRALLDERALNRMELAGEREPLDRLDRFPIRLVRQRAACTYGNPVEQNRADAADLYVAGALRPGQSEAVADDV